MFFSCAHCKGSVWLVVWYGFAWVHNFWRSFRPRRTGCQWCYWLYFLSAFSMSNFYIQYVWKYAAMFPHQQVECLSKSVCERDLFLGTAGQGITLWHQFLGNKATILARDILEVRLQNFVWTFKISLFEIQNFLWKLFSSVIRTEIFLVLSMKEEPASLPVSAPVRRWAWSCASPLGCLGGEHLYCSLLEAETQSLVRKAVFEGPCCRRRCAHALEESTAAVSKL